MSMTKAELKNAFREAAAYEFRDIPHDESLIQYEFSAEFEKKMNKLINRQKKKTWHWVNTAPKRIALIAAVAIMLFTTACSVPAIREPVVKFVTEVYETFTEYFFESDTVDTEVISKKYKLTYLPSGFEETDIYEDDITITTTYENENGDSIWLTQRVGEISASVDAEHGETKTLNVSGYEVDLYLRDGTTHAIWIQDTYVFEITCYGDFSEQDMVDLIESVE